MGLRIYTSGLPWWLSDEESASQGRRHGFDPSSGKILHALEQLKPVCHNHWACFLEPGSLHYRSLQTQSPCSTGEALAWRAAAAQRQQREAHKAVKPQRSRQRSKAMISSAPWGTWPVKRGKQAWVTMGLLLISLERKLQPVGLFFQTASSL